MWYYVGLDACERKCVVAAATGATIAAASILGKSPSGNESVSWPPVFYNSFWVTTHMIRFYAATHNIVYHI